MGVRDSLVACPTDDEVGVFVEDKSEVLGRPQQGILFTNS